MTWLLTFSTKFWEKPTIEKTVNNKMEINFFIFLLFYCGNKYSKLYFSHEHYAVYNMNEMNYIFL